jgi:hypothetical protein
MPVTMICPNLKCGRTVVAAESARGKVVRCAHCQILFLVPRDARNTGEGKPPEPPPQPVEEAKRRGRR